MFFCQLRKKTTLLHPFFVPLAGKTGRIRNVFYLSIHSFVIRLVTGYFEHESTNFGANWHNWSVGQGHETFFDAAWKLNCLSVLTTDFTDCQTTLLLRDSLSLSRRFLLWLQPWSLSTIMLLWHSFLIIIIIMKRATLRFRRPKKKGQNR